jgi:hypothetical protein
MDVREDNFTLEGGQPPGSLLVPVANTRSDA